MSMSNKMRLSVAELWGVENHPNMHQIYYLHVYNTVHITRILSLCLHRPHSRTFQCISLPLSRALTGEFLFAQASELDSKCQGFIEMALRIHYIQIDLDR